MRAGADIKEPYTLYAVRVRTCVYISGVFDHMPLSRSSSTQHLLISETDNEMKAHCGPCSDPDFNHECQNHLFIKILFYKPPKGVAFDTKSISSKCFFFFSDAVTTQRYCFCSAAYCKEYRRKWTLRHFSTPGHKAYTCGELLLM